MLINFRIGEYYPRGVPQWRTLPPTMLTPVRDTITLSAFVQCPLRGLMAPLRTSVRKRRSQIARP